MQKSESKTNLREAAKDAFKEALTVLQQFLANESNFDKIARAAELVETAFKTEHSVFSCGNGGSMCDAMHFAEELSGRFRKDRATLPAMAISDSAHITCAGNDFGFAKIFSSFLLAHGRRGDVLLAISTSGASANIIEAVKAARERGMTVIALTGREESVVGKSADLEICALGGHFSDRIQELHIKIIHTIIELVERKMFPENY